MMTTKKLLAAVLFVCLAASPAAATVFHFAPNSSAMYSNLVKEYGADYVYRGNGATDGAVLTRILGRVTTGGNDVIRLWPGTFVAGASVTVAKIGVTIEGATGNAGAVIWDCDTTDSAAFSVTAAGVTLRNFMIDEPAAGTTDTITSTGVGFVLDNIVVQGGNIASAIATVNVTGDHSVVKNCKLHLVRKGILIGGSNCFVTGNHIDGTDGTAGNFGITLTGAAARTMQVCTGNRVFLSGATNPKGIVVAANSDLAIVSANESFAGADPLEVQADTYGVGNLTLSATITATTGWLAE